MRCCGLRDAVLFLGEIEESQEDETEQEQAVTSQLAYLRMQLDEKRRHIEAEKHRAQAEWEDQRRRLGQTAFWYVIGKAQGGQPVEERPGSEVRFLTSQIATENVEPHKMTDCVCFLCYLLVV